MYQDLEACRGRREVRVPSVPKVKVRNTSNCPQQRSPVRRCGTEEKQPGSREAREAASRGVVWMWVGVNSGMAHARWNGDTGWSGKRDDARRDGQMVARSRKLAPHASCMIAKRTDRACSRTRERETPEYAFVISDNIRRGVIQCRGGSVPLETECYIAVSRCNSRRSSTVVVDSIKLWRKFAGFEGGTSDVASKACGLPPFAVLTWRADCNWSGEGNPHSIIVMLACNKQWMESTARNHCRAHRKSAPRQSYADVRSLRVGCLDKTMQQTSGNDKTNTL
ncbi:hypothetical protein DENSPDRAFT_850800 [Dentipellis sp. KUC8613]|nr:hypothetical protein DENSPDRAFT_850800 [Dentipellis sp. KUC8613]